MIKDKIYITRDKILKLWFNSNLRPLVLRWNEHVPFQVRRFMRFGLANLFYGLPAVFLYLCLVVAKLVLRGGKIIFFRVQIRAIGHLSAETEMTLRKIKYAKDQNIYIGYASSFTACNRYLLNMFKRHAIIVESIILAKILGATFLKRTEFVISYDLNDRNYSDFKQLSEQVICFDSEEEKRGKRLLDEMGIKENDWFVCFHSRDSAYHGSRYRGGVLHHGHRDCDIENYLPAAEYIAERGGGAIRMGAAIDKRLPKQRHPRIIDYATEYRSDFMDIYLPAHCKFFLGSTAGLFLIAMIFGVPTANANFIPIDITPFCAHDLFIPKKLWSLKEKRFLTFPEIFNSEIAHYTSLEQYNKAGIRVIENSPEETLGLAAEMYSRLSGVEITKEEEEIRNKYISLYKPHHYCYEGPPNICVDFLRKNLDLLGSTLPAPNEEKYVLKAAN